jgi:hypothetical protein
MIEVVGLIEPRADINVGTFWLHLEQPFTATYDKEGRLVHFEVLATDKRDFTYYVALHKDERFKGIVKEEAESINSHLSYMTKDAQPLLKLSRTTIQRVLDRMVELRSAV